MRTVLKLTCVIITILFLSFIPQPTQTTVRAQTGDANGDDIPTFDNVSASAGLTGVRGDNYCWGDYNNDGYEDLLISFNNPNYQEPLGRTTRLFENNGPPDWDFTEVTAQAGITTRGYCSWGDYDNDGYLDFYQGDPNDLSHDHLWHNNGDGTFTDMTEAAGGVTDPYPTLAVGWGDYDCDGYLDLYLLNWRDANSTCYPDTLWHNNGNGTFTDVTVDAGVDESSDPAAAMGYTWGDYNDDGWPDIYVGNYLLRENYLYENQQDGTFSDVAEDKGVEGHATRRGTDYYYGHSPGSAFADLDNDGIMDLWVSNLAHRDPYRANICDSCYFFNGNGHSSGYSFTDIFEDCGVPYYPVGGNEENYFGVSFADWDDDGDMDMFLPQIKSYIEYSYSYMFQNNGDNTFTDVSNETDLRVWDTVGGAWCDYDKDGDMDVIMEGKVPYESGTYDTRLFQSQGNPNNWVGFKLTGTESNKAAIGARIKVTTSDGTKMMRDVESMMGNHCYQNSMIQHFGLGGNTDMVDVTIRWGPYKTQELKDIEINQVHEITEPESESDLSIDEVTFQESIKEGIWNDFFVTLKNQGEDVIKGYDLILRLGSASGDVIDEVGSTDLLYADDEASHQLVWDTTGYSGKNTLHVTIENIEPGDANQANNDHKCVVEVTVDAPPVNQPPVITAFTASPEEVGPEGQVALTTEANDPDGDTLTYDYTAEDGELNNKGDSAVWTAPFYAGTYEITVTVSDGHGNKDLDLLYILVTESENSPPTIISLTYSPAEVYNNGSQVVTLTLRAHDDDGISDLSRAEFDLSDLGGPTTLVVTGHTNGLFEATVVIQEGLTPGDKFVTAVVYDREMDYASANVVVTVNDAIGVEEEEDEDDGGFDWRGIDPIMIILIIIIVALVFGAIYMFIKRR